MYFYTPVSKTDKVSKIKSVNVANDTFYELTMPWKSKLLAEIKKFDGVITHVMFVVTCNSNWNQLSDESTEEVLKKHWPEQFLKHEQSYGIFLLLLNSIFQQIYSDHLLWKQVWITVKTCYTINFIFIFFCNFPTLILVAFGNIFCQLSKQAQKRSVPRISLSYHILLTFLIYWCRMVKTMSFKSHLSTCQVEECS